MISGFARKFFENKKCWFCGKYGPSRLADGRAEGGRHNLAGGGNAALGIKAPSHDCISLSRHCGGRRGLVYVQNQETIAEAKVLNQPSYGRGGPALRKRRAKETQGMQPFSGCLFIFIFDYP
jgi:hypothetical protein